MKVKGPFRNFPTFDFVINLCFMIIIYKNIDAFIIIIKGIVGHPIKINKEEYVFV